MWCHWQHAALAQLKIQFTLQLGAASESNKTQMHVAAGIMHKRFFRSFNKVAWRKYLRFLAGTCCT